MAGLRPLAPTTRDQARFVGRERETARLLAAVRDGRNALVLGEWGSGKSSLLSHVEHEARTSAPRRWVRVNGETARTAPALMLQVLTALDPTAMDRWYARLGFRDRDAPVLQPSLLSAMLADLDERADGIVVCIDGIVPAVAYDLFGAARNDVWSVGGAAWVVAANSNERELLLRPPADAFFDEVVTLGPLDRAEAERVLALRFAGEAASDPAEADALIAAGAGSPSRLLRAGQALRDGRAIPADPPDAPVAGSPRERLEHWLRRSGSTSAGDPAMLEFVGVSRQRIQQLLAEMEGDGQVAKTVERPAGRGRPRQVYSPTWGTPDEP